MTRTLKLVALVLTVAATGVVTYDRGRADDDPPRQLTAQLATASPVTAGGYRVEATPKTVIDLGLTRHGCTPVEAVPARTVCDVAVAFPDVGLTGTVTFVGSTDASAAGDDLAIRLGS